MRSAKEKVILCQNCACYHAFYREGIVDFWKEEKGICSERKKVVEENDTCDFGKPPYPIVIVTLRALDRAAENLEALERFFNEECF